MFSVGRLGLLNATLVALAVPAGAQSPLPEGAGKQLVMTACTRCHGVDKFTGERHTREDWAEEVGVMLRYGTQLTKEQAAEVTDYLTASFPGKPKPHGVAIQGPVEALIKEWAVATPGARPHDPAVAPDGAVWSGRPGTLGRLDPHRRVKVSAEEARGRLKSCPTVWDHTG